MAIWKTKSATGGSITGGFEYESGTVGGESHWQISQDEKPFLEQAKIDREMVTKQTNMKHRKFATIPDIVAIEVMQKYNIDIHNPEHSSCPWTMKRFKQIIMQDYPHLVVNKA